MRTFNLIDHDGKTITIRPIGAGRAEIIWGGEDVSRIVSESEARFVAVSLKRQGNREVDNVSA